MFEIQPESEGATLAIKASGKLVHEDYAALRPELEKRIAEHGKLSVLFDISEFEGWSLHGAWDDFAMGMQHLGDFTRIAVIGDARWQEFAINLADALMRADVRFFQKGKRQEAWAWTKGAPSP